MATARYEMRWDEEVKRKAEKASALSGFKNVKDYLVDLVEKDATKVIAEHESIMLEDDVFDRFTAACTKARKPNKALREALKFTRKQGVK